MKDLLLYLNIILCLLVIGEALALIIGMNLSGFEGNEWLTLKNYLFLLLDIALGLIIFILTLEHTKKDYYLYILVLLTILFISHLYREIEYFFEIIDKFCANIPLFIFNNIKFFLLISCICINLYLQFNN